MREQHQPHNTHGGHTAPPGPNRLSLSLLAGLLAFGSAACSSDSPDNSAAVDERDGSAVATSEAYAEVASDATVAASGDYAQSSEAVESGADERLDVESDFTDVTEPGGIGDDTFSGANFVDYGLRPFVDTATDPLSTFSLDVDHGSYTVTRAALDNGQLPPPAAVRPEEFVNSFHYGYPNPTSGLTVTVDGTRSPFVDDPNIVLMRVGVSAEQLPADDRPPVALTFVVDTSGSMDSPNRLPMVKYSLRTLVDALQPDDTLAIVTYSDDAGVLLSPTPVSESGRIEDAIDDLETSGSTNLEAGLRRGYELAEDAFRPDGINGVVLASDGIANVGATSPDAVLNQISRFADRGISLVTLGYGMEGYNDAMMEQLANDGDGFYAYIDAEREARRLFSDEITSTLVTVARDSKVQVEFNPEIVERYRLIGYENRAVLDSDFRNDAVDAGELGAGHESTAIYELSVTDVGDIASEASLATVRLRWESPTTGEVTEIDTDVPADEIVATSWSDATDSLRLAVAVTGFAEHLRFSGLGGSTDLEDLAQIAEGQGESDLADQMYAAARLVG